MVEICRPYPGFQPSTGQEAEICFQQCVRMASALRKGLLLGEKEGNGWRRTENPLFYSRNKEFPRFFTLNGL
ncbi:hypothetical protein DQG13_22095 [Paenibacillus sp. YN15]|nr:hypothetical protein DQG13_22095 [Paenibacillus sp. YN15]